MECQNSRSSQNNTHFALSLALYAQHTVWTQNRCAKQEDHRVARTNKTPRKSSSSKKTEHRIAETDLPGRRIRTTHRTHKIIGTNQINQTHKIIRTNQINRIQRIIRTNQINRTNKIAQTVIERLYTSKSSTRSDWYLTVIWTVKFFEVVYKIGRLSDRYITVILFKKVYKIGRSDPQE